jgi:hypothetical protein
LRFQWVYYPEAGSYRGPAPVLTGAATARAVLRVPEVETPQTLHIILVVTDSGSPPLTRYQRVIVTARPG